MTDPRSDMYAKCMQTDCHEVVKRDTSRHQPSGKSAGQRHYVALVDTSRNGRFLPGGQEAGGSNPLSPTKKEQVRAGSARAGSSSFQPVRTV